MTITRLIFIGDIVGPGLDYLERRLPLLREQYQPDFVVANAENLQLAPSTGRIQCGMSPALLDRVWALGIDLVTGGNHSWDGPFGHDVHDDPRVLRPLNYGQTAPGRGMGLVTRNGIRIGVVNLASREALSLADDPLGALDRQLALWQEQVDLVLVDFHGASTEEKLTVAFAAAGQVAAVVGTHTHVPSHDAQILTGGVAYVSDVGMTGAGGGILGYHPDKFVNTMRNRLHSEEPYAFAPGPVVLGAVYIVFENAMATHIERLQ